MRHHISSGALQWKTSPRPRWGWRVHEHPLWATFTGPRLVPRRLSALVGHSHQLAWGLNVALLLCGLAAHAEPVRNGFDLSGSLVPVDQIVSGGPPRDGIPAIDRPVFIEAHAATHVRADDLILGVVDDRGARAFPIFILNWHEVVNDTTGVDSLIVTWCPLCGSGMAFRVPGQEQFGVSGLLFNSDVLLYDRASDSLWSQIMNKAVTGPRRGQSLQPVLLDHSSWADWQIAHPQTRVLSAPTRSGVDYRQDPYAGYERSRRIFFPVDHRSRLLHPKERVLGVVFEGHAFAYPLRELPRSFTEVVDDTQLLIEYEATSGMARASIRRGEHARVERIPAVTLFWFAWYAFHPETLVFRSSLARSIKP